MDSLDAPLEGRKFHRKPQLLSLSTSLWRLNTNRTQTYFLSPFAFDKSRRVQIKRSAWRVVGPSGVIRAKEL